VGLIVGVSVAYKTTLTLPTPALALRVMTAEAVGASTVTPGGSSPRTGRVTAGGDGVNKPGSGVKVGRGVFVAVGRLAGAGRPTTA
jgi:hypothetical protein